MKNETKHVSHRDEDEGYDHDPGNALNMHRTKLIETYYGIDEFDDTAIESIRSYPFI